MKRDRNVGAQLIAPMGVIDHAPTFRKTKGIRTKSMGVINHARTFIVFALLALLLAACDIGGSTGTQPTAGPPGVVVNGFGVEANHVHAMLAFPNHVVLLATHYGLFRSTDDGKHWQEVAAGPNQLMEGLMTYALKASPLDSQRVYALTQVAIAQHTGTLGLYSSADQGRIWSLAATTASLTSSNIYTLEPGNDTPTEVYVYLPALGPLGLKVSLDAGQHFTGAGTLPFGSILGLLAIPGAPGQLLAYGTGGMARSVDGGNHWQTFTDIQGAITEVTTAGPHSPIYASGDAGVYTSMDGGKTFKLVYTQASLASLSASPLQPMEVFGETAESIYRSTDGGHSWQMLPHIQGHFAPLAADPLDAAGVYLPLSYPTEFYYLGPGGTAWQPLTPKV